MAINIDWNGVREQVRNTTLSYIKIAKSFGISDTAIRRKIAREQGKVDWTRTAVNNKKGLVVQSENEQSELGKLDFDEKGVNTLILKHLRAFDIQFGIVKRLTAKVEHGSIQVFDKNGIEYSQELSLKEKTAILKDLSITLERVVSMQRKSLKLDVEEGRSHTTIIVHTGIIRDDHAKGGGDVIDVTYTEEENLVSLKPSTFRDRSTAGVTFEE